MSTTECSCRLWPSPGMYVVTSRPLVSRTRATLRRAEFGFFGVVVYTRVHTPRFCGHAVRCGDLLFHTSSLRPFLTSWLIVGIRSDPSVFFAGFFEKRRDHSDRPPGVNNLASVKRSLD